VTHDAINRVLSIVLGERSDDAELAHRECSMVAIAARRNGFFDLAAYYEEAARATELRNLSQLRVIESAGVREGLL
jgi:hypothetical protein